MIRENSRILSAVLIISAITLACTASFGCNYAITVSAYPTNVCVDGGISTITARVTQGGAGVKDHTIRFTTSNLTHPGSCTPYEVETDASGYATTTYTSGADSGRVRVTAIDLDHSSDSISCPVDVKKLTVTVNKASGQTDPAAGSPINFTAVFSESVSDFTSNDVTIGGTAGAAMKVVTGSGTTYNVAVSGMTSSGTVTAGLDADVAHNSIGCGNTASTGADSVDYTHVIHVETNSNDQNSGLSWTEAKQTVSAALCAAVSGGEVWVAEGTYQEAAAIELKAGVGLYGGFAGTEIFRDQRNWSTHQTILDASYGNGSVVTVPSGASSATVIDGFTIQNGWTDYGGGIYCGDSASPRISHNTIKDNLAYTYGAGIYCSGEQAQPRIADNVIRNDDIGGGIYLASGSAVVTNNTIRSNVGSGIYIASGSPTVVNNIVAFNSESGIARNSQATPEVHHNNVYRNFGPAYSGWESDPPGNIQADPILLDGCHIDGDSPCTGQGDNTVVETNETDIDGQTRIMPVNGTVDIGADEWDGTVVPIPVVRVTHAGDDLNDGLDWGNDHAMQTVQAAIDKVAENGYGEVWVKSDSQPYERIQLKEGVFLYGGFDGTESARPAQGGETVLDGGQGGAPFPHVVTLMDVAVGGIDGFTIQNGFTISPFFGGGGIYSDSSNPVISNNHIVNNSVGPTVYGGGIYCFGGYPIIENNVIESNHANDDFWFSSSGGGIYCSHTTVTISGNTISNNTADGEGGGIFFDGVTQATIDANTFDSNDGGDHGGGIALHDSTGVSIVNNLFVRNHANGAGSAGGGAIQCYYSPAAIVNNTFVENYMGTGTWPNITPTTYGGAIHVRWPSGTPQAVNIVNNIFYDNRAGDGDSVGCTESGIANILYCDAWPNNGAAYHYYDFGNPPTYLPPGLDSQTCTFLDPSFCGSGIYWLQPNSPVHDIGQNPAQNPAVPTVDKDGRPRPGADNYTDMGAYEDNPSCP